MTHINRIQQIVRTHGQVETEELAKIALEDYEYDEDDVNDTPEVAEKYTLAAIQMGYSDDNGNKYLHHVADWIESYEEESETQIYKELHLQSIQ